MELKGQNWGWWAATDWRNGAFSAQLFVFGRRLQDHLTLPAGLEPKRVKYAMAWPNAWATLFNKDGFPALGFDVEL